MLRNRKGGMLTQHTLINSKTQMPAAFGPPVLEHEAVLAFLHVLAVICPVQDSLQGMAQHVR